MKLTILGSGTSVPHPRRATPAHWLETSTGSLLLDAGAAASHRMAQEQLDWPNLDAIWISHFHLDHLGGLTPFLFGTKWAPQTQDRDKPLRIFGPKGLRRLVEAVDESNDYGLQSSRFGSRSLKSIRILTSRSCRVLRPALFRRRTRKKVWHFV